MDNTIQIVITYKSQSFLFVISAEAEIQVAGRKLDPRLRGNDLQKCLSFIRNQKKI